MQIYKFLKYASLFYVKFGLEILDVRCEI